MTPPRLNPLQAIDRRYTWGDYYAFKDHLKLPMVYMKVIFLKYPELKDAVGDLGRILNLVNEKLWERRLMNEVPEFKEKLYHIANIPPLFFVNRSVITKRSTDLDCFVWLTENVEKTAGETFYFFSEFSEGAMNAAFILMKAAIEKKIKAFCISFPELLIEVKDWNAISERQARVNHDQLLVIYAVGGEYTTEFTTNVLQNLLRKRQIHQLTTILCSSLDPTDYALRYHGKPEGVEIGFVDEKIKKTLAQLCKELKK